jgi:SPP1 gp7 family putative phage head morphogenesis protein
MPRSSVDLSYAIGLPPEEAIRYFEQKGYAIGFNYHEVWAQAHARAFTVAGVLKLDVLTDIKTALKQALNEGKTLRQFEQSLLPTLTKKGWIGNGLVAEQTTGELQGKQLTPRRMETIFQTNMQSSYMAGRYQTMKENVDNRPFWQYWAIMDKRTRPAHALLNGRVFRFDDPIWSIIFPPNGYRCRCSVRAFNQGDLDKRSLVVSNSDGHLVDVEQPIGNTGITRTVTAYKDPVTGQYFVPDAGFGFNPGQVAYQPELDKYPLDVARQYVHGTLTGDEFSAWYNGLEQKVSAGLDGGQSVNALRKELAVGQKYPVGVLTSNDTERLGTKSQTVWLSDDTLTKQLVNRQGQNVSLDDYRLIQQVLEQPSLIIVERDLHMKFIQQQERWWAAVVKVTRDGTENWLQTFHPINEREIERLRRTGKIILDK